MGANTSVSAGKGVVGEVGGEMMSKYTPGPWKMTDVRKYRDEAFFEVSSNASIFWLAKVGAPDDDFEQAKANAHLIAAAPEMYELLKEQIECYNQMPMSDLNYAGIEWIRRARKVLAKAEGREVKP